MTRKKQCIPQARVHSRTISGPCFTLPSKQSNDANMNEQRGGKRDKKTLAGCILLMFSHPQSQSVEIHKSSYPTKQFFTSPRATPWLSHLCHSSSNPTWSQMCSSSWLPLWPGRKPCCGQHSKSLEERNGMVEEHSTRVCELNRRILDRAVS